MSKQSTTQGLEPVAAPDARVLILGTMPGAESLRQEQYYAKRGNAFWPIMGRLVGAGPELEYEQRCDVLRQRGIALWDVLHQCKRKGSLDSAIDTKTAVPNDFETFLAEHPGLRVIMFNGTKAEQLFRKHVHQDALGSATRPTLHLLPSTSPANTHIDFELKLASWRTIERWLQ